MSVISFKGVNQVLNVVSGLASVESTTVYPRGVLLVTSSGSLRLGDGTTAGGAAVGTESSVAYADVTGKPTTLAGYGITDGSGTNYVVAFGHVDISTPITVSGALNVASVTDGGTGKFNITFTTALPNADYIVSLSVQTNSGSNDYTVAYYNRTTTGFQVQKFLAGSLDGGASGNFSFVVQQV